MAESADGEGDMSKVLKDMKDQVRRIQGRSTAGRGGKTSIRYVEGLMHLRNTKESTMVEVKWWRTVRENKVREVIGRGGRKYKVL